MLPCRLGSTAKVTASVSDRRVGGGVVERFFAEDVLAGAQGGEHHRVMQKVRRGDADGIGGARGEHSVETFEGVRNAVPRGKARRNTERFANENGVTTITVETLYDAKAHYARLAARVFGLSERTRAAMQRRIEAREGILMRQFEPPAVGPRIALPTLVVHDRCEVEVVDATKFDRLSWDMCVNGGWCGGIVDGKPTRVDDLIPESGTISAEDFAKLAMRADGWPESEPFEEKFIQHLKELFIKYFGVEPVDVEEFRHLPAVPFSR
eukprot:gene29732-39431_t